ncbi:UDP-2,3-diacylglucosamine diphosphatase [Serpentinimonas barnesii]|uniref:UDP-2,3-diacylglucosamine diphosphatase n=1 Tax=Serpentinimonas barnesii TaxID=1458427 RepID=UPI0006934130|nr:UDP-2,3-diacylglucosamine diphosphatase [Serpentinimonas barnesii]
MNEATVPAAHPQALPEPELVCAAPVWERVEFISDLHLRPEDPATVSAWLSYLEHGRFDALFILGDLFELWFGDDMLQRPPEASGSELLQRSIQALQAASARAPVYLMHGNRDFLLGSAFAQRSGVRLIADPCVLEFANQRWLLSHGDAWCLDDRSYQAFRQMVRAPAWQQGFLARPLAEREALARMARHTSESQRNTGSATASAPDAPDYGDLDAATACHWLRATGCQTLIHGHTHRPGQHDLGAGLQRLVLSDWCGLSQPPRREVLRLDRQGQFTRISPEQAVAPTPPAPAPQPAP